MKAIIVLAILLAIALIVLIYKRESDTSKLFFSFFILISILSLALIGTVMRSLMVLFLIHFLALVFSYGGLIYYVFTSRKQWILWLLPVGTLVLYVLLAWIGNEHLVWIE
jgi:hypothetical protein